MSNAASSHNCVCLHASGYKPKRAGSVYEDKHGRWCGNENCRAVLGKPEHDARTRCEYVLPALSVLKEFSPETRHCVLDDGHEGDHPFEMPKLKVKS